MSNALIAEFMGLEPEQTPKGLTLFIIERPNPCKLNDVQLDFYEPSDLKYDTDWNWLMPVVERLENKTGCSLVIYSNCSYWADPKDDWSNTQFGDSRIEVVYQSVIEIINHFKK